MGEKSTSTAVLVLGGAALTAVGSFLPWATVTAPFVGTINVSGMNGDGKVSLVLAGLIAAVGWRLVTAGTGRVPVMLLGLATAALGVFEYNHVSSVVSDAGDSVAASVGVGVYMVALGGGMAFVGSFRPEPAGSVASSMVCPFCAERIQAAAIVCRHCGRDLPGGPHEESEFASAAPVGPATDRPSWRRFMLVPLVGVGLVVLLGLVSALSQR